MIMSLLLIGGLIVLNALFAMAEMALISVKQAKLKSFGPENALAQRALHLARSPHSFLPTVQVGVTLISILEGMCGPGHLEAKLQSALMHWKVIAPFAHQLSVAVVVVAITFLMLLFGELIPKRLGLLYPEKLSLIFCTPLTVLAFLVSPAVWLLNKGSDAVFKCLGMSRVTREALTEEELRAIIAEGTQVGVLEREEGAIIERIMRMNDRPVRALMTPRNELFWVDSKATHKELIKELKETQHTRIVVCEEDVDHPIGVLLAKDVMDRLLEEKDFSIEKMVHQPPAIPDTLSAQGMIEKLQDTPLGIVFIFDEYGSFEGIITPANLLEAILGDDQFKPAVQSSKQSFKEAEGTGPYYVDGVTPPEEVCNLLGVPSFKGVEDYHTIAGVILSMLKRLPTVGDKINYKGWQFKVTKMDRRRIEQVLITRPESKKG